MRLWSPAWLGVACSVLTGCGYQGEPLPPALMRPVQVVDLRAVERGPNLAIEFTVPKVTTENLKIKEGPDLELRIGPWGPGGEPEWVKTSVRVPENDIPRDKTLAHVEYPAMPFVGKSVVIGVNARGPGGRTAGWSNLEIVPVVPPLPQPEGLELADAPTGVHLVWNGSSPGTSARTSPEFRIFRKLVAEPSWTQIGTSPKPEYTDETIEYGKTYEYEVQAIKKTDNKYAESEISEVRTIRPEDKFPPAVPAGLTPVAGAHTIELVWQRNTEKDFAGYRVYRNGQKIVEGLTAPAYSDSDVKQGMKYEYQVTAVDTRGNESAKTAPVTAELP